MSFAISSQFRFSILSLSAVIKLSHSAASKFYLDRDLDLESGDRPLSLRGDGLRRLVNKQNNKD